MECLTEEERKKEDRRTKKDIDSPQTFEANNKVAQNEKQKKTTWIFVFQIYGKF